MATIFTKILNHELPGHFVYEDDKCGVFLSIAPLREGHALIVPKAEVDHWLDLSEEDALHCFAVARRVGKALMKVFKPRKIGLMIAGLEVPHAHIHAVPIMEESDLDFSRAGRAGAEELAKTAAALRAAFE